MSTVDRAPRSSKWSSIHTCARSRQNARSCLRKPTSALRRVSHIAAVPVVLAINLDSLIEERQTGRCKNTISGNLLVGEDFNLSRAHVSRRQEQLDCRTLSQQFEIDDLPDEPAQRVVVERIKLIRRQESRDDLEQLQRTKRSADPRDAEPEFFERLARALSPASGQPMGHHRCVHCTSARRAHSLHLDARLFKEPVENTPSERAMGAAALESQADAFHLRYRRSELPGDRLWESFPWMQIHRHAHTSSIGVIRGWCHSTSGSRHHEGATIKLGHMTLPAFFTRLGGG